MYHNYWITKVKEKETKYYETWYFLFEIYKRYKKQSFNDFFFNFY